MTKNNQKIIFLFFMAVSFSALGSGFSDTIFSNYFKEVYNINAIQRGIIEFPRELPGVISLLIISVLYFIGNYRIGIISQFLIAIAILILALFTPSFPVMLIFLFIYSLGAHMFMTLQDAIGISLFNHENLGKRMGQYKAVSTASSTVAGIMIFIGFRSGFFIFNSKIKLVFLIAFVFAAFAGLCLYYISGIKEDSPKKKEKVKFVFRKEYKYYYMLSVLNGTQKQIMIVFGPWVLIELLSQGADTIALLTIISSFIGIFFVQYLGKWIDSLGIRKIMYADAISFIGVYLAYGIISAVIVSGKIQNVNLAVILTGTLFVCDRISMQIGMVRSVYLNSIIVDKNEITQTLSTGISLDHIVTIAFAPIAGYIWTNVGPQYIFFIAATLSLINVYIAKVAKINLPIKKSI
ncbi:MFS transporter [Romboutsia sp.]|uniref:MFS transporter n=1 Tax=Romboutsia sp. TaxID=1965302 RepID=UPI003F39C967